jgi:hypothetical protein
MTSVSQWTPQRVGGFVSETCGEKEVGEALERRGIDGETFMSLSAGEMARLGADPVALKKITVRLRSVTDVAPEFAARREATRETRSGSQDDAEPLAAAASAQSSRRRAAAAAAAASREAAVEHEDMSPAAARRARRIEGAPGARARFCLSLSLSVSLCFSPPPVKHHSSRDCG